EERRADSEERIPRVERTVSGPDPLLGEARERLVGRRVVGKEYRVQLGAERPGRESDRDRDQEEWRVVPPPLPLPLSRTAKPPAALRPRQVVVARDDAGVRFDGIDEVD